MSEEQRGGMEPVLPLWQAAGALNAATLIWGSQHAVIKDIVESASPSSTNAARFAIAAVCALPWLPGAPWRPRQSVGDDVEATAALADAPSPSVASTWTAGAELGCWSFLGFALQAVGLQYTTASRSAFLLYLNVKLVPLLALLLYGRPSPRRTWVSALLAFTGTALLSSDGSPPNIGDLWSVMAAVASACFILRLEEASTQAESTSPEELNAATLTTSAALCSTWAAADLLLAGEGDGNADVSGIVSGGIDRAAEALSMLSDDTLPILYLGIVTTFVAQWLQALGQSRVAANDAAVIYALDPVYAAGFAYLLLDEKLGTQGLLGAGIVLVAVLLSRLPTADTDSA